jgi:hypothetical protein
VVSVWFLTARNQGERQSRREKVKCRVFHSGQTSIARESERRKGSSGWCEFQIGCQNELPEKKPTNACPKIHFGNRPNERSHAAQNCVVTHGRIP